MGTRWRPATPTERTEVESANPPESVPVGTEPGRRFTPPRTSVFRGRGAAERVTLRRGAQVECPEENVLVDFVRGELDDVDRDALEAHLDSCQICSAVMVELARFEPGSDELAVTDQSVVAPDPIEPTPDPQETYKVAPRLTEGDKVGRYVILQKVGAGGMGVVYAAYDPELDRKLAIKLLMTSLGGSLAAELEEQRARLLREAQAMAKLSHPNVITVHDVGEFGDQVFVAMEFVDGGTLTDWIKERRTWRQVMDVYLAAGRGLAAAHRADLVHRDFKPDNVLIDKDGRVLVTDFGLARPVAGKTDTFGSVRTMENTPVLSAQLTRTGALVGTPAFMAPEQLAGERSDAMADQFSFCVALYAGLYGERPFEGRVLGELMANVSSGRIKSPPRDAKVPRRIRRALYRGLSVKPEERFATMEALLAELSRDPVRAWRRWGTVLLPSAVLGVGLVAYQQERASDAEYCNDVEAHLEGRWDDRRSKQMRIAFNATGKPYAPAVWKSAKRALDNYAELWVKSQRLACKAEAAGTQSQALLALRMNCLERQLHEFETLVDVLTTVDASALERVQDAITKLPRPSECENIDALAQRAASLDTPEKRAQRQRLDRDNARAQILRNTGRLDESLSAATSALETARSAGDRWSEADALATLADVHDLRGDPVLGERLFHEAMTAALASDHRAVVARVARGLLWIAMDPGRPLDEAERWYQHGLAALEQQGKQVDKESQFENAMAAAYLSHGEYQDAESHMRRALEIRRAALGNEHPSESSTWTNLGQLYASQGRLDEALDAFSRAQRMIETEYGPLHPFMAGALENLGAIRGQMRQYDEARVYLERALELRRVALGEDHPNNADSLINLANVDRHLGDYAGAEAKLRQAHPIVQAIQPGTVHEAEVLLALGRVQRTREDFESAIGTHRRAYEVVTAIDTFGLEPRARFAAALGRSLAASGRFEEARSFLQQAVDGSGRLAPDDVDRVRYELWWATSFAEGVPEARRARIYEAGELAASIDDPLRSADALQALTEVATANGELARATRYAQRARAALEALGPEGELPLRRTTRWLDAHGR